MTAPAYGASAPLPYDLHPWSPVVYADTAAALTLPLSASGAGAGVTGRRGTAPALPAPLTASTAAGRAARRGTGAALTLPLTAAPAAGHSSANTYIGPGTAILLPFTQVNGTGVKRVSLQAGLLALPLVDMTGSGTSRRQGSGVACSLGLHLSDGAGGKGAPGIAQGADLRILADRGDGRRFQWHFLTPSDQDYQRFDSVYPSTLTYGIPYASTVWQDADGLWHVMRGPNPTRLSGALRIYEGGRLHPLSVDDIAVLTAAGYADNLMLKEMH